MFDPKIIKEEFLGLVGLRQTQDPNFSQLSSDLLYTGDNMLLNHPLINPENLEMVAKDFSNYEYSAWSNLTDYKIGNRVKETGVVYEAIADNTDKAPAAEPTFWKIINLVSLYLEDIFNTTAEDVVVNMFNLKRDVQKTKTLISSMRFYEGAGNINDKIINEGKLVGVMIELRHSQNLVAVVERIGVQLSALAVDIPMYVYHSSQPKPIQTFTFNQTVAGGFQWVNPAQKIKLHHLNNLYDAGGYFFIMYDQNQLDGAMAINKRMSFNIPCPSCSMYNFNVFERISRYMSIRACSIPASVRVLDGELDVDGTDLWNLERTQFDYDRNWGLNFDFTVRCDATDFIVRQKDVFADALRDNILVRLLDTMVNSTRVNGIKEKVQAMANIALSAEKLGGGGLRDKAIYSVKNLNFELSDLDNVCMPCSQEGGIRVKSYGLQMHGNNLTGQ